MRLINIIGDKVFANGFHVATLIADAPETVSDPFRMTLAGDEFNRSYCKFRSACFTAVANPRRAK